MKMPKAKKEKKVKKVKEAKDTKLGAGDQLALIDIHPENAKPIIALALTYKKYVAERQLALAKEVELKNKILDLVKAAKLQPLENGNTTFTYEGVTVSIEPQDEKVKVSMTKKKKE